MDCGDHNTSTATGSDKLGYYNSLTEQLYGTDSVTGMSWGLIDDPTDRYNGASKSKAIYTANTWPDEYNTADGRDKGVSFRYTKNQYENDIERHLDYGFTLPDGTYTVRVGFCDPWSCSNNPTLYANYGQDTQQTVLSAVALNGNTSASGKVRVTDGKLTLNFRTDDKAINVSYIIIGFDELDPLPTVGLKGDVNLDGAVNADDAKLLQSYLLGAKKLTTEQAIAADINENSSVCADDLAGLKAILIKH